MLFSLFSCLPRARNGRVYHFLSLCQRWPGHADPFRGFRFRLPVGSISFRKFFGSYWQPCENFSQGFKPVDLPLIQRKVSPFESLTFGKFAA